MAYLNSIPKVVIYSSYITELGHPTRPINIYDTRLTNENVPETSNPQRQKPPDPLIQQAILYCYCWYHC